MLHVLKLDSLDKLDPRIQAAFTTHLRRATQDCIDRPSEKKARRVLLEVELTPIVDEADGGCSEVNASFKLRDRLPDRRTRDYRFIAQRDGRLLVNDLSPSNPAQLTIDDVPAPGQEVQRPAMPPADEAADGKSAAAGD